MNGTVIGWHLGDVGPRLAAAIGWRYQAAPGPTVAVNQRPNGPVALVGYSLGCSGLRAQLEAGTDARAVVLVDGTHSAKGPGGFVLPAHRDRWHNLFQRARAGLTLVVATTLGQHRYTQGLPGAQAYASTGRVLEAALGLPDGTLRTPQSLDDGNLHVRSYPSADMDAPAHARQLREVLPALWAELVVPALGAADPHQPHEPIHTSSRLGLRALGVAREQLAFRVRETPGPGSTPQVSAYLQPCRRGGSPVAGILDLTGSPLGLSDDATAWCAAFASWCTATACPGLDPEEVAHGYRASVAELVADAKARGAWRGPAERPELGWLAIWTRAGGDPVRGGTGHVGRVSFLFVDEDGVEGFRCIEGNHNDEVAEVAHRFDDPTLRGWIAT
jgi:hypothetical protein